MTSTSDYIIALTGPLIIIRLINTVILLGPLALLLIAIMADHQGYHTGLPQTVQGPPQYTNIGKVTNKRNQETSSASRSRSRSPMEDRSRPTSPPAKKYHTFSDLDTEHEQQMNINDREQFPDLISSSANNVI